MKAVTTLLSLALGLCLATTAMAHPHIVRADGPVEIDKAEMLADLRQAQVIFIGELHDNLGHHRAQLSIIEALQDDDAPLAIGLEMFRSDSQPELDEWSEGSLSQAEFLPIYKNNWSMWEEYRELFMHARDQRIKLLGLNIPRELTSKVARYGFKSLSLEQRQFLGDVQCQVNPEYAAYMRLAMGGHGGHGSQYLFFCEAQLLWDTMMAARLVEFTRENPDYRVVVLAGSAHAWKYGIPRQMLESAEISYRVVLPEVPGRIDRGNLRPEVADYLWLDVGPDGWVF